MNMHSVSNITPAAAPDSHSLAWVTSCSTKENLSFLSKMFAWVWLYIMQSWNSAEAVNPCTSCDGGVLRAHHSPLQNRLLFFPAMSILLGISASLHTTCCGPAEWRSAPVNHNHKDQLAAISLSICTQMLPVFHLLMIYLHRLHCFP